MNKMVANASGGIRPARSEKSDGNHYALFRSGWRYLRARLPKTRSFDYLSALVSFLYRQKRLPRRNSGLFNDYLFFIKTGKALEDALRQFTTDKVYAKYFIDGIAGRKVTPQTYAVFDAVEDIKRTDLPDRCVLKPAHATGKYNVYLEDANSEISPADLETLRKGLALDVYSLTREFNYRNLRKRIICEEFVGERSNLIELKIHCFQGTARIVYVAQGDGIQYSRKYNFYDRHWNRLDVGLRPGPQGEWLPMPEVYPEMRDVAEKIARHFDLVRIDMFLVGNEFYVGEITHCHNGATLPFESIEWERKFSQIMFE